MAGPREPAIGPDRRGKAASWLIDGMLEGTGAASTYVVKLEWGFTWERGEFRIVTWRPGSMDVPRFRRPATFNHSYAIVGTWTAWKCQDMVRSQEEDGLWITSVRLGLAGQEEFQFLRDRDWNQVIHPAASRVTSPDVAVRGPDNQGHNRNWLLQGRSNDVVTIQLRVMDGEITVTIRSDDHGTKTWQSAPASLTAEEPIFLISGSWNSWRLEMMKKAHCLAASEALEDTQEAADQVIFQFDLILGTDGVAEFQIAVDDWGGEHQSLGPAQWRLPILDPSLKEAQRRLYPNRPKAGLGDAHVCGPDNRGHGLNWAILGDPGQHFRVTLDPSEEGQKVVWWTEIHPSIADA